MNPAQLSASAVGVRTSEYCEQERASARHVFYVRDFDLEYVFLCENSQSTISLTPSPFLPTFLPSSPTHTPITFPPLGPQSLISTPHHLLYLPEARKSRRSTIPHPHLSHLPQPWEVSQALVHVSTRRKCACAIKEKGDLTTNNEKGDLTTNIRPKLERRPHHLIQVASSPTSLTPRSLAHKERPIPHVTQSCSREACQAHRHPRALRLSPRVRVALSIGCLACEFFMRLMNWEVPSWGVVRVCGHCGGRPWSLQCQQPATHMQHMHQRSP